jgi:hypothetical protein
MATPYFRQSRIVSRIRIGDPAWNPQAMLAEEMNGMMAASCSASNSPRSALISMESVMGATIVPCVAAIAGNATRVDAIVERLRQQTLAQSLDDLRAGTVPIGNVQCWQRFLAADNRQWSVDQPQE